MRPGWLAHPPKLHLPHSRLILPSQQGILDAHGSSQDNRLRRGLGDGGGIEDGGSARNVEASHGGVPMIETEVIAGLIRKFPMRTAQQIIADPQVAIAAPWYFQKPFFPGITKLAIRSG